MAATICAGRPPIDTRVSRPARESPLPKIAINPPGAISGAKVAALTIPRGAIDTV